VPLFQPLLRRLNAIKQTPTGLIEIGNPVECVLELCLVTTVWGTNDGLMVSVILSFHGYSREKLNGRIFMHHKLSGDKVIPDVAILVFLWSAYSLIVLLLLAIKSFGPQDSCCCTPSCCPPNHDLYVSWIFHDHLSNLIAQLLPIMYEVPSPIIRHYL